MNLQFLLVLLALFYCNCSELNPVNDKESVSSNEYDSDSDSGSEYCALYPQGVGIWNEHLNCYINALLYSLYNLPFFQRSVFKTISEIATTESSSVTENSLYRYPLLLEMGAVFKALRTGSRDISLDLSRSFFPAVEYQMKWPIGDSECVLEFWDQLIDSMPEAHKKPFKENFQFKSKRNFYRKDDGKLIKSVPETGFTLSLPLSSCDDMIKMFYNTEEEQLKEQVSEPKIDVEILVKEQGQEQGQSQQEQDQDQDQDQVAHEQEHTYKIIKLGDLLCSSLNGDGTETFIINPEDQNDYPNLFDAPITEPQIIPVTSVIELENAPPILVLGIKRLQMDPTTSKQTYNAQQIDLEPFYHGSEKYVPVSVVCFKTNIRHYINLSMDVFQESIILHDDERVHFMSTETEKAIRNLNRSIGRSAVLVFCMKASLWDSERNTIQIETEQYTDIQEVLENLRNCESLRDCPALRNWFKRNRAREQDGKEEEPERKVGRKVEDNNVTEQVVNEVEETSTEMGISIEASPETEPVEKP